MPGSIAQKNQKPEPRRGLSLGVTVRKTYTHRGSKAIQAPYVLESAVCCSVLKPADDVLAIATTAQKVTYDVHYRMRTLCLSHIMQVT